MNCVTKSRVFGIFIPVIIFLILGILLIPQFLYKINPDGFSYFSIAEKYLSGDYTNAVNGYWGPLYSWLLIPLIGLGIAAPLSAKILSLIFGVLFLYQTHLFYTRIVEEHKYLWLMQVITALITLYFAFNVVTPDFLFAVLLLSYTNLILSVRKRGAYYLYILSGLVGALLYLTKAYGLPFFIVHFFVSSLLIYIGGQETAKRKRTLIGYVSGMLVFLILVVPWILTISAKYGYRTMGTSGSFNHVIAGPDTEDFPMHLRGLLPPPNSTANSVWEDISFTEMEDWSATESMRNLKYQIWLVIKNTVWIMIILSRYSVFSLIVMLLLIWYLYKKGKYFYKSKEFYLLVTMLILFSGYALILVVTRYLWLCVVILLGLGVFFIEQLCRDKKISVQLSKILIGLFLISFLIYPVIKIAPGMRGESHLERINRGIKTLSISGKVASDERWHDCVWLAYFNNWQYYGEQGIVPGAEYHSQLQESEIDYFIDWSGGKSLPFAENIYPEISDGKYPEFKVYKLRE